MSTYVQRRAFLRRRIFARRAAHVPVPRPQPCAAEPRYANYLRDFFPLLEQLDANYAPARGAAASGIS